MILSFSSCYSVNTENIKVSTLDFEELNIISSNKKLSDYEWYISEENSVKINGKYESITDKETAAKFAFELWYDNLENYRKNPSEYTFEKKIFVSFDEQYDVWIVHGNIGTNKPDEVALGVVPMAIIKSNGHVLAVFWG